MKGPYHAAVESRNYDLARTIVKIATVQHADFVDDEANDLSSALADDQHSVESIKGVLAQVKSTKSARAVVRDSGTIDSAESKKDEEMFQFAAEMHYSFGLDEDDVKNSPRSVYHLMKWGEWPASVIERVKATGAPFQHTMVQGKLKGRKQVDRVHHLSPLLRAAWSGNINMVRFFLDKSKLMAAYKHFAASNDFSTNKLGPEQARADFMKAVKEWVDKEGKFLPAYYLIIINNECARKSRSALCHLIWESRASQTCPLSSSGASRSQICRWMDALADSGIVQSGREYTCSS